MHCLNAMLHSLYSLNFIHSLTPLYAWSHSLNWHKTAFVAFIVIYELYSFTPFNTEINSLHRSVTAFSAFIVFTQFSSLINSILYKNSFIALMKDCICCIHCINWIEFPHYFLPFYAEIHSLHWHKTAYAAFIKFNDLIHSLHSTLQFIHCIGATLHSNSLHSMQKFNCHIDTRLNMLQLLYSVTSFIHSIHSMQNIIHCINEWLHFLHALY
jgi:hypothetical protein